MGDTFVDAAFARASDFDRPLQDLACEAAWGGTWSRDDTLTLREKSLVTLSMLIALRASAELKGHVRGPLNNGATPAEIRAVIMHAATYCGFPGALSAMQVAKEVVETYQKA
jgi:4-carboxymuconolactone decarboxylase